MNGLCERCGENTPATNDDWCGSCILEVETALSEFEAQEPELPIDRSRYGVYTLADLEMRVAEYEEEYGINTDTLLELHRANRTPIDVRPFDRHVWLSYYREILESRKR